MLSQSVSKKDLAPDELHGQTILKLFELSSDETCQPSEGNGHRCPHPPLVDKEERSQVQHHESFFRILSLYLTVPCIMHLCRTRCLMEHESWKIGHQRLAQKVLHSFVKSYFFLNVGGSETKILSNQWLENGLIGQTSASNYAALSLV